MNFQTISAGKIELKMKSFDIRIFMRGLFKSLNFVVNNRKLAFNFELDNKLPSYLVGDPYRIQQVITNFVSNASKFTPPGGIVSVHVKLISQEHELVRIRFSIIDNGAGISELDQSRLFQSFSQINPGELQGGKGMGLGLFICKELVEKHGGLVGVKSNLGKGSEFYFEIPFAVPKFDFIQITADSQADVSPKSLSKVLSSNIKPFLTGTLPISPFGSSLKESTDNLVIVVAVDNGFIRALLFQILVQLQYSFVL